MKAEKLSTEIAALERQSGKAKNAVIKKVLTGKINKLKAELEAITSAPEAKEKIKKAKSKISKMTVKEFASYIKQLAKDPKFSFLKSMTSDEIVRDIKRTAKPVGWRFRGRENVKKPTRKDIKEKNDVYYEGRRNRSDVSRSVRLATGGGVDSNEGYDSVYEIHIKEGKNGVPFYVVWDKIDGVENGHFAFKTDAENWIKSKKYANGGGVDINDFDMPVIRTQFEDEEYEFKNGGGVENKIYYGVVDANNKLIFQSENEREAKLVSYNYEGSIVKKYSSKVKIHQYAKGGSIGDSGTITDKNSMFVGKLGLITGEVGNMYEVKVLDNGNYRTVLVKKNGISVVSDEYAKGGGIWEIKDESSYKVLSTHKTKKEAKLALDKIFEENKGIEWLSISKKGFDDSHEFANGGNTGEPHRAEMSGMMKNGGGTKKYYNHKITVTDKFDNVYDVALFRAKGDAFIALNALDKAKTSDLFYELKENK